MCSIPWKQLVISLGVAVVIVWRVPFAGLRAAFRNLEMGSLFLALLCLLVLLFLRAYKWHRLMAAAGKGYLPQSLRSLFGGYALGLITPGRLGELGHCAFVRKDERAQVALLTVYDRLLDLWALLTAMGASLFFLAPRPAAVFGVAVWLALLPMVMGFPALVSHFSKVACKSRHFRAHFMEAEISMPRVQTPRFALMAVGAMWADLASFFFLLRAFFPTGFATAAATYPYIVLAGDLPVAFCGVGVREGTATLLLSPYAVPASAAVGASLLCSLFGMLLPAAVGVFWLVAERARSRVQRWNEAVPESDPIWSVAMPQPTNPLTPDGIAPSL